MHSPLIRHTMAAGSLVLALLTGCVALEPGKAATNPHAPKSLAYPQEKHLKNVRQLTFGGNNAEAYFSFDNKAIVFQSDYKEWGLECDHIFYFDLKSRMADKKNVRRISTGEGRTTCAYFMPGNKEILFASTHEQSKSCPHKPQGGSGGYTWPIFDSYDIYVADLNGNIKRRLTNRKGYDAEATVSPKGDKILFTSDRSGDLELWTMNLDGTGLHQITNTLGYDGGAFFSPDGSMIVYRASRPKTEEEATKYKDLLAMGLVEPTEMEIFVCNADGTDHRQVTNLGKANWAPYFHPSGKKVVFASNHAGQRGFQFNIYMVNLDGTDLERITHDAVFDAFPMFSFDGKKLIWSSNRFNGGTHDTNVFIADWVD